MSQPMPAFLLRSLLLLAITLTGCVNLDKRDPAPFRRGQKTKDGQTVASKGDTKKSISKMQKDVQGSGFTNLVKDAWPFRRKTQFTVQEQPMAKDDPTRLDYMPENVGADLYVEGAKMSEKNGDYARAVQQYGAALGADRQNRNALIGLARLQHRAGKTEAAINVYRDALAIYQNDAVIMNDLGICYARNNQFDESIQVLRAATQAAPDREMYVNNLAASLVEANRYQEAVTELARIRPAAVANYNVGYLLQRAGKSAEAADYLRQALSLDPTLRQAQNMLDRNAPKVSALPAADRE